MDAPRKCRFAKITAIVIAFIIGLYIGLSIYGAVAAMLIPRLPLINSPASVGLAYEDVSFTSRGDGVLLRGWLISGKGDSVIMVVHGGFQNRVDDNVNTLGLARDLVEKGFDILLFDLRGRGESEGKGLSLSNIEHDIGGAIDYLRSHGYSSEQICIIGYCSGAASACIFASHNNIGALVLDGCFANIHDMFNRQAEIRGIPEFLVDIFVPGVLLMTNIIYSYNLVNPLDVMADVNCPILFIHEEYDDIVTHDEMWQLFVTSINPANEFWEVSDAEHSQSYETYPNEYIDRVNTFLSNIANTALR